MPFISLIVNPKLLQVNRSLNLMNQLLTGFDDFSPFSDWMMTVCRLIFQNGNLQNPNFVWGISQYIHRFIDDISHISHIVSPIYPILSSN